ncbi:MAG: hypothetical protein IPQ07_44930 [Myxococcales bacterium]|nr:hypothetical protein [Myxococcales bacterium]
MLNVDTPLATDTSEVSVSAAVIPTSLLASTSMHRAPTERVWQPSMHVTGEAPPHVSVSPEQVHD